MAVHPFTFDEIFQVSWFWLYLKDLILLTEFVIRSRVPQPYPTLHQRIVLGPSVVFAFGIAHPNTPRQKYSKVLIPGKPQPIGALGGSTVGIGT